MSTVGIKELKNRLTQYLRQTKKGIEIVVTERGRPIAVIQPIRSAKKILSLEARLARFASEGLASLPTRKPLKRIKPVRVSGSPISKNILDDRR